MLRSLWLVAATVLIFLCLSTWLTELSAAKPSNADIQQIEELEKRLNSILEGKLHQDNLVKVWTGTQDELARDRSEPAPRTTYGVLLSDSAKTFRIFDLQSLAKRSFVKSANAEKAWRRVAHERATFTQVRKKLLAGRGAEVFSGFFASEPSIAPATFAIVACLMYRNDQVEEAIKLLDGFPRRGQDSNQSVAVSVLVLKDISDQWMRSGIQRFADARIDYRELKEPFQQIVKQFPETANAKQAAATVQQLDRMIREEKRHQEELAARKKAGVRPTEEQRIADLIFQLRGQNGAESCFISDRFGRNWYSSMYTARGDFFFDAREQESPAHQLVELGDAAVPQLIESLDDDRFTRSLDGDDTVLRVGDCAAAIISRISGRRFDHLRPIDASIARAGQDRISKAEIQKWWQQYRRKGRKQMLMEGVAGGESESLYQFDRLLKEFPDSIVQPLITGATKTDLTDVYTTCVRKLGSLSDPRALDFLRSEFEKPSRSNHRGLLAVQLTLRGEKNVVPQMISQWEQLVAKSKGERPESRLFQVGGFGGNSASKTADSMVQFLMATEDPAVIDSIAKHFAELGVADRMSLLRAMLGYLPSGNDQQELLPKKYRYKSGESRDFNIAFEEFLHQALKDTERYPGLQLSLSGYSLKDPRICDFAAYALARCWPQKYKYPRRATDKEREAVRQMLLKQWQQTGRESP